MHTNLLALREENEARRYMCGLYGIFIGRHLSKMHLSIVKFDFDDVKMGIVLESTKNND